MTCLSLAFLLRFVAVVASLCYDYILNHSAGIRVAVLVNDMASVNIDAQLLQDSVQFHESKDKMVELLGSPVVPFCPFYFGVPLLKPNIKEKGTLIINN